MKKALAWILCLAMVFLASGCHSSVVSPAQTASTLPPPETGYIAPAGDMLLDYTATVALYLPSTDGQKLLAHYTELSLSHDRHSADAIVRALIAFPGNSELRPLGNGISLSLYGAQPVEVSGGVCTVNLSASALQLDQDDFYTVCLALASTLCELPDIHAVNVLVADQAVGMDISSILPMGCLTAHPGESLPALWEQLLSRRTPLGESPAAVATTASAALYFPLADGSGVIPETHALSFPGQTPQQLAQTLLTALSGGALYTQGVCTMPDINSMLVYPPSASDLEGGGRLLTLQFIGDLDQRLAAAGVDPACFIASVTQTLLTFIPAVAAVDIYVGASPLTTVYSPHHSEIQLHLGRVRRTTFKPFQMDQVTLYMTDGSALIPVQRTVAAAGAASPRTLVTLLMNGVSPAEAALGLLSPIPAGLGDDDILGVAIAGDTLLLNLSSRFAGVIAGLDAAQEQQLCYAIVNTLCHEKGVRRVVFFFDGQSVDKLSGTLSWGGEFLYSPALIQPAVR